jgi:allantoin racemase
MHIAVVNCNMSSDMTDAIGEASRAAARPGTLITAVSPTWGVDSAEGFFDSYISAAATLDLLAGWQGPLDGVVLAGFGEHGREGVRQLLDVPVVDITEAAAIFACLLGYSYGVVTTTRPAVQQIRQSLQTAGMSERCVAVRATGMRVLDLDNDIEATIERFAHESLRLMADGAEVIVLGCAGMAGLREGVQRRLPAPVIDGVAAAVSLVEDLVHHGMRTSKVGAFAPLPAGKHRTFQPEPVGHDGSPAPRL